MAGLDGTGHFLSREVPMPRFQTTDQPANLDRTKHVWRRAELGHFLCVLCGGISRFPSDDVEPKKYVPLTDADRAECPQVIARVE